MKILIFLMLIASTTFGQDGRLIVAQPDNKTVKGDFVYMGSATKTTYTEKGLFKNKVDVKNLGSHQILLGINEEIFTFIDTTDKIHIKRIVDYNKVTGVEKSIFRETKIWDSDYTVYIFQDSSMIHLSVLEKTKKVSRVWTVVIKNE